MKQRHSIHGRFLFVTASAIAAIAGQVSAQTLPEPGSASWPSFFAVDPANDKLPAPPLAAPKDAHLYKVTLKGEIAGFDVGRVFIDVATSAKGYSVQYRMEQKGVARWFSDAEARTRARGTFGPGTTINSHYYFNHDFEREDDQQFVELYRAPGARRLHLWTQPQYDFYEAVPEDLAEGAVDPMAALIALSFTEVPKGTSPCDRKVKVYDGRRRFDLIMTAEGVETIRKGGKGRFSGEAHKCKLVQVKVAGYREKDKGDIDGDLFVYLAQIPKEYRTPTFAYAPVLIVAKQGIITARLEGKYPTMTMPDGRTAELGAN